MAGRIVVTLTFILSHQGRGKYLAACKAALRWPGERKNLAATNAA